VFLFALAAGVQLLQGGNYFDGDTGYHLAVARLIGEHGTLRAFPWTSFSWLADHYADKELLFHVLMVPFAHLEPNLAARIAGTLFGGLALSTLYLILRAERVPRAILWPLVALLSSGAFVHRFALVRPHLLSIPLALLVIWGASRRNWGWLLLACVLFPLSYTAWHLPLVLVAIVEGGRLVTERRVTMAAPMVTVLGLAIGVLLHPNFPANLEFFWIQNVEVLFQTAWAGAEGFELGGEFKPFSPMGMVRYLTLPTAGALVALALGWRDRQRDSLPFVVALTALAFAVLTFKTQRFIEYEAPVAALALGLAWGMRARNPLLPAILALVGLVWTAGLGMRPIEMLRGRTILFPPAVAEELARVIPRGAQVVTCDWEFTGEMMLALPDRRFLVALDPVFFYRGDPVAYRTWFSLVRDPPPRAAAVARDDLRGDYVLCDSRPRWRPFIELLDADPEAEFVGRYGYWYVMALPRGPWSPPGSAPAPRSQ